jgi:Zn-dependent peptidase ImmA (M78 family)
VLVKACLRSMMKMRIAEMTLRVPYIADESIERDAEALLAQYAHAKGLEMKAPIPIEDIVEKHLKLRVEFNDLHRLLGVPRSGVGTEPDIFGAIWLEDDEIVIDESLDPEERPRVEGRYRFTLAHEGGGHRRLHRPLVQANSGQASLFGDTPRPIVVCRSSQAKERVELQADLYASCLLMPRKLIMQAWHGRFGNGRPRILRRKDRIVLPGSAEDEIVTTVRSFDEMRDNQVMEHFARPFAEQFLVSPVAMRIRLENLGLLHREVPRQRSLLVQG